MTTCYLWRDSVDDNQFWIGTKTSNGRYIGLVPLFVDALSDAFGMDAYEWARNLESAEPVEIELEMRPK